MVASIQILVVEDDKLISQVLDEALTDGGFVVVVADTSDEAMALLNTQGAEYRALITDIDLPGKFSGWDLARHAREINDALPIIYMSGASTHHWASQGVPNSQIMPKPFAVAQVVIAVSQLINAATNSP